MASEALLQRFVVEVNVLLRQVVEGLHHAGLMGVTALDGVDYLLHLAGHRAALVVHGILDALALLGLGEAVVGGDDTHKQVHVEARDVTHR